MGIKDLAVMKAYHADRVKRFGVRASEALGWKNQDSQRRRFERLAGLGDFAGKSVLDVGCGHADLYAYLRDIHGDDSELEYTGIDYVGAFLEVAVRQFGNNPGTRFLLGEFGAMTLPKADFVICCGALNYRNDDPGYIQNMIAKLFDACTAGLGLSLLKKVDFPDGILVPCDPDEVADYCRRLTPEVQLRVNPEEDYFTVFMYRGE